MDERSIAELVRIEITSAVLFTALGMVFPPDDPAAVLRDADVVLTEGDPPVGFVALGSLGDDAHLEQISVHPDHGCHGVGTRLLTAAITRATADGYRRMVLTTFRDIPWNAPWYTHHGFHELPYADCPPELRAVRDAEIQSKLDAMAPRIAMSRPLP